MADVTKEELKQMIIDKAMEARPKFSDLYDVQIGTLTDEDKAKRRLPTITFKRKES